MQAEVEYRGETVGRIEWTPDAYGVCVNVDCGCPADAPLLRCYGVRADAAPLLIGLPAPEGARLRLTRHLSRETLRAAGYAAAKPARFYLACAQDSVPPPPKTEAPAPAPPRTGDTVLDSLLAQGGICARQEGDTTVLRCAFAPDRPFALAPAFVLCAVENGEAVLRWTKKDAAAPAASEKLT